MGKPYMLIFFFINIYLNNDTPTMIKIITQTQPPAAAPIIGSVFVSIFSVFVFNFSSFPNKYVHNKKEIYYLHPPPKKKDNESIKIVSFTNKIKHFSMFKI